MANTLTLSSTGLIKFDNFERGADEDAYDDTVFTMSGTAKFDTARSFSGTRSLRIDSGNAWDALHYENAGVPFTEMGICVRVYQTTGGSPAVIAYCGTGTLNDASTRQWQLRPFDGSPDFYKTFGVTQDLPADITFIPGQWNYFKIYVEKTAAHYEMYFGDPNNALITSYRCDATAGYAGWATDFDDAGWRLYASSGRTWLDNACLFTNNTVTITSIVSGMKVVIMDANNVIWAAGHATGTSLILDMGATPFPLTASFYVFGTDGNLVYSSASAETIYGGDSWAYSGDTTAASGGNIINVINNGV